MPDAQLVPSGASPFDQANTAFAAVAKREKDSEGKVDQAATQEASDISGIESRTSEGINRLEGEAAKMTPPKMQAVPPPNVQPTDPKQIWGSAAMFLAAFGGLMTRQPLTTAMNAAAGVIKAYRENDTAAANQAFQTWKIANDNAMKQAEFEQKAYDEALSGIDRRINSLDREGAAQVREAVAKFQAAAANFHNDTALQIAQAGDIKAIMTFTEDYGIKASQAQVAAGKAQEEHELLSAWADWKKAHPNATPDEQLDEFGKLRSDIAPSHQWTPSEMSGAEDRKVKMLMNSTLGKQYSASIQNMTTIQGLMEQYPNGIPGPVAQSALQDAFTRDINGGMAIRGFQAKMNTEHAGLWDKAVIASNQLARGGNLSPAMVQDMLDLSRQITIERATLYAEDVDKAQKQAKSMGLDPDNVVPTDWNPDFVEKLAPSPQGHAYPHPTQKAIDLLKSNPSLRQHFDDRFGPGAAEKILGQ